jgi:hypothetical protein
MSNQEKCVICEQPATGEYEGEPSCGKLTCEFQIQEGLDYIQDRSLGS